MSDQALTAIRIRKLIRRKRWMDRLPVSWGMASFDGLFWFIETLPVNAIFTVSGWSGGYLSYWADYSDQEVNAKFGGDGDATDNADLLDFVRHERCLEGTVAVIMYYW